MTEQQIDKFIRDMRGGLIFVSVLNIIGVFILQNTVYTIMTAIFVICFIVTFFKLGNRTKDSLVFARISSSIFLLGFPIFTYIGIRYLIKLAKPEVELALAN